MPVRFQCHILMLVSLLLASVHSQTAAPRAPTRQLQTPNFEEPAESSERFGGTEQRTLNNIKQLLGKQLVNAVESLAAVPLVAARRPAIVSPDTGAMAVARYAGDEDEDSNETGDESSEEQPETDDSEEPMAEETYDAYRDNFYDLNADGTYVYGYSLPNGVRRYERRHYSQTHGIVVEGFYTQARQVAQGVRYELRCYRSDGNGYHPLRVEYLQQPPRVRRDEVPDVDCFNN